VHKHTGRGIRNIVLWALMATLLQGSVKAMMEKEINEAGFV